MNAPKVVTLKRSYHASPGEPNLADLVNENIELRARLAERERPKWGLQLAILVLGAGGLALAIHVPASVWGYVLSLAAQPFFMLAAWRDRQYGVFILAFVFCATWASGLARALGG